MSVVFATCCSPCINTNNGSSPKPMTLKFILLKIMNDHLIYTNWKWFIFQPQGSVN